MMFRQLTKLVVLFCTCILLFLMVASEQSRYPKIVDLAQCEENISILGIDDNDRSCFTVASGDINADGYDDFIIGAQWAMLQAGQVQWAGKSYVIFGSATPPETINLDSASTDIIIYGENKWDRMGITVTSGDINGDGYDDVIIGANAAEPGPDFGIDNGEIYIIFGNSFSFLPYIIDLNIQPADLTIYGNGRGSQAADGVACGDINGDGYDDLIIGAKLADPAGRRNAGETYVIFGGSTLPDVIDLRSGPSDMVVYGDNPEDKLGCRVTSGDINSDGYDDVIIGSQESDPDGRIDAGKIHVIFGGSPPSRTIIDLNSESADVTIYGDDPGGHIGFGLASSDINRDGVDDLVFGSYLADPVGRTDAGKTYIIFGREFLPAIIDLNSVEADVTIYGENAGDRSGHRAVCGDINDDGYSDLIIGAYLVDPEGRTDAGGAYVVFGSDFSSGTIIDLNTESADITIMGDSEYDRAGGDVSSGDFNGDGSDDIIVGAIYDGPVGGTRAGKAYVIFGAADTIEVSIDIEPDTLNLKSKGNWITAYIGLPEGYDANDIEIDTVRLHYNDNSADAAWGDIQEEVQMIKFDRESVIAMFNDVGDYVELKLTGEVAGTKFEGTDTIRVKID